jgi:hypothetical protein
MPVWAWPLLGGLGGAAVVLAFAVPIKVGELKRRGTALQQQIEAGAGPSATQVQAMQARLRNYAISEATSRARREADRFLMAGYGLNQQRMQRIDALTRTLNTLVGR